MQEDRYLFLVWDSASAISLYSWVWESAEILQRGFSNPVCDSPTPKDCGISKHVGMKLKRLSFNLIHLSRGLSHYASRSILSNNLILLQSGVPFIFRLREMDLTHGWLPAVCPILWNTMEYYMILRNTMKYCWILWLPAVCPLLRRSPSITQKCAVGDQLDPSDTMEAPGGSCGDK